MEDLIKTEFDTGVDNMIKLVQDFTHWEMVVEVGNDWGEPSYEETRKYDNEVDLNEAIENISYYDMPRIVRKVTEYEVEYVLEEY